MGRLKKNNASWFSHDANMLQHRKIKAIRNKFGFIAYGIYCGMLENLADREFNRIPYTDLEMELISGDFGISATDLTNVLDYCLSLGLFGIDELNQIFSEELDSRLKSVYDKRARSQVVAESKKRDEEGKFQKSQKTAEPVTENQEPDISVTEKPQEEISATEKPQSRVDKSRVYKSIDISKIQREFYISLKPFVNEFDKQTLREFYDYWSEPNKSRTKIRMQLEKTWDTKKRLTRWANNGFNSYKKDNNQEPELITYKPKS